jgi:PspA-Associated protein
MIVRLMNEGQYRVGDDVRQQLDRLDDEAVAALDRGDEETLDARLAAMWELVQAQGERLADADLHPSDAIVPPADLTLEETRALFADDGSGLIPDLPAP